MQNVSLSFCYTMELTGQIVTETGLLRQQQREYLRKGREVLKDIILLQL